MLFSSSSVFLILNMHHGSFLPPANEVWGKVIFLHLFVILLTGGVSASVHGGIPPPWDHVPPRPCNTLGSCTPRTMHLPPRTMHPKHRACWEIWSTQGWYASYWNVILFTHNNTSDNTKTNIK